MNVVKVLKNLLWTLVLAIPPLFAALWAGATAIANGAFSPWSPQMIDMDVYRRTADIFLAGGDIYNVPDELPFIYPPVAALLSLPFTWFELATTQQLWLVVNALFVMAMVHRLGLTGWRLSLASAAAILMIEPLRTTLGFGQVNIVMTALVFLDIVPGPRALDRIGLPRLPQGWLIGIATAIKLTPALFAVYLFFSGKVKPALVAFGSFCVATIVGFAFLPQASMTFWTRLLEGDSGINTGLKYFTNQSVIGNYIRFSKENPDQIPSEGLLLAVIVGAIGLAAAILWERNGHRTFAVTLCGFTTLMMSPISWSHHFIWFLPLIALALRDTDLPKPLRIVAIGYGIWGAHAPFNEFGDYYVYEKPLDEFELTPLSLLVDAGSMIICIAMFVLAFGYGLVERRRQGYGWLPLTLRATEQKRAGFENQESDDADTDTRAPAEQDSPAEQDDDGETPGSDVTAKPTASRGADR